MSAQRKIEIPQQDQPRPININDMLTPDGTGIKDEFRGRRFNVINYKEVRRIENYGAVLPVNNTFVLTDLRKTDARATRYSPYSGGYCVIHIVALDDASRNPVQYNVGEDAVLVEAPPLSDEEAAIRALLGTWAGRYAAMVGSDPELFVIDGNGEMLPAFEFAGPKSEARAEQVYWDGYQGEFNTIPRTCLSYHTDSVQQGLRNALAQAQHVDPKAKLAVRNVFEIPPDRLLTDDRKYVMFGCNPSLSVYDETTPEVDPLTVPFRSAGGHLHFTFESKNLIPLAVKELDRVLAVMCVSLFQYYDEPRRRMLYGRAGEYRLTKYGFEYRPLSNAWMIHPLTTMLVYEVARRVLAHAKSGSPIGAWNASEEEVRRCINNCDVELAQDILRRNQAVLKALFGKFYNVNTARLYEIVMNGLHTVLENPEEFSPRWFNNWQPHSEAPNCSLYKTDWAAKYI